MTELTMHRLLRRQLKKAGIDEATREQMKPFLEMVNEAYRGNDNDIKHLENIIEKSSQELFKANQLLKEDVQQKTLELDAANKRYETVASNIKEILFQLDQDGKFSYLNSAWTLLTGLEPEESLGKSFATIKSYINEEHEILIDSIAEGLKSEVSEVLKFKSYTGSEGWIEVSAKKVYNDQKEYTGIIGTLTNITKIKETELALKAARDQAEKASKAKDEFLSTMSHEIRTPLNAIVGISNLLLMNDILPDQMENLEGLKFSSEHLLSLINDILDFSKIESGKIEFDASEFSIHDFLLGMRKNYSYSAEEKGLLFKVKKDEELPEVLIGDITRLSQVVSNLIGNAIKFTSEGGVILDVEVMKKSKDKATIKFEIKDTGIGIPENKIDKIFEKFAQAESNTTREYGGTGLGLPICQKLLDLQGSKLNVSSVQGQGSKFWFELEFGISERFNLSTTKYIDLKPSFGAINGMVVLVAEDNKMNIRVARQFLDKWGVDFDIVLNGQEAVDQVTKRDYDLVLMDLQMPVMNGYDATRNIRAMDGPVGDIPILALTASTTITVRKEAQSVGMNDYIMKPFNPKDLYQSLKYYYDKKTTLSSE